MTPRTRAAMRELLQALLEEEEGAALTQVPAEPKSRHRAKRIIRPEDLPPVSEADAARARLMLRKRGIYVGE